MTQLTSLTEKPMTQDKYLQRLLLLQVRDGVEPPELAGYGKGERVYNSAVLIREGYVVGGVVQDAKGEVVSATMTELTPKGYDFIE